jgi:hypothetical protein
LDNLEETVEDDEVVRSSVKRVLFYHTQLLRLFRLSLVLDANRLSTPTISKNAKLIARKNPNVQLRAIKDETL